MNRKKYERKGEGLWAKHCFVCPLEFKGGALTAKYTNQLQVETMILCVLILSVQVYSKSIPLNSSEDLGTAPFLTTGSDEYSGSPLPYKELHFPSNLKTTANRNNLINKSKHFNKTVGQRVELEKFPNFQSYGIYNFPGDKQHQHRFDNTPGGGECHHWRC